MDKQVTVTMSEQDLEVVLLCVDYVATHVAAGPDAEAAQAACDRLYNQAADVTGRNLLTKAGKFPTEAHASLLLLYKCALWTNEHASSELSATTRHFNRGYEWGLHRALQTMGVSRGELYEVWSSIRFPSLGGEEEGQS